MSNCEICNGEGYSIIGEFDNHEEVKCPECNQSDGYDEVVDYL